MSYLEKLLDGVEVKWKTLGNLAIKITSGGTPDTKKTEYWENGAIPWMSSGEVNLKTISETEKFITEAGLKNSSAKLVPENSVVMALAGQGKTRGQVARTRIELTTNQSLAALIFDEKKVSSDYIFHFLETQYENLRQISSGNSGRGGLNLQMISAYKVPIPCPENPEKSLAIQSEIVRILDAFTALTAELTAELTARKKQYNYYRDQLLSFDEEQVEWKTLGDLFDFKNGINKEKEFFGRGDKIINFTDVFKKNKLYEDSIAGKVVTHNSDLERFSCKKGDVFFTRTSETKDEIGYASVLLSDMDACVFSGFLIRARPIANNLLPEYCAYCFSSKDIRNKIVASSNMTTRVTTTGTALSKIKIPIPSLERQLQISQVLDKFETLTRSLTGGLPKEIQLRQKQYEYYRDLLFSFPKSDAVSQ